MTTDHCILHVKLWRRNNLQSSQQVHEATLNVAMNAMNPSKITLRPKFEDLLLHLSSTDQMAAAGFFTKLFVDLNAVASEEQLLELFIELSTTAFLGISFDELALAANRRYFDDCGTSLSRPSQSPAKILNKPNRGPFLSSA